ncbi:uncharacterized protein SAPINGB_P000859 [Magnusiomyces paraingens]|uniref:Tyrosine-protein phosphatase domain-containing protein n=1 Tax=Magnusiomyces paraingens TaxID=2606893 RepID=A0A5E8B2Q9_9ASCO|nr:uncharacterized protein SAPINGB_P000859 [Saprochaete ingens]VVT45724.1 unnamed protein product [Saprochaete ingens]
MSGFDQQKIVPISGSFNENTEDDLLIPPSNNIQTSTGNLLNRNQYSIDLQFDDVNRENTYGNNSFANSNEVEQETQMDQEPSNRFQSQSYEVQRTKQEPSTQDSQLQKTIRLCNVKLLVPPLNFALVAEDVYRSGHPLEINHPFIENLNLRTIVYIGDPPSSKDKGKDINSVKIFQRYQEWAKEQNIRLVHFHQPSAKEPFRENNKDIIKEALEIILDTRNLPVLLNSNKGKHRIGVLIGVMRVLLQGWSLATTFDEYIKFANGKSDADLEFIERFKEVIEYDSDFAPQWLRKA